MATMPWWAQLVAAVGAVLGAVVAVLRGLWRWERETHEERRTRAQRRADTARRIQAMKTQRTKEISLHRMGEPNPEDLNHAYLSTAELDADMVVEYRDTQYRINRIRTSSGGYYVELFNLRSRVDFIVMVAFSMGNARMWKPVGGPMMPEMDPIWDVRVPQNAQEEIVVLPFGHPADECFMPWCSEGAGHPGRHKHRAKCRKTEGCVLGKDHEGECRFRNLGHSAP